MGRQVKEVVKRFRQTMNVSDFRATARLLADDYRLEWPQSGEVIGGRDNLAPLNQNDPADGSWQLTLHKLSAKENEVISDVSVTDEAVEARANTFSTVEGSLVAKQLEFWPDSFAASEQRRTWAGRA